ncbi:hypothetical protein [Streptomyces sp. NPDC055632]
MGAGHLRYATAYLDHAVLTAPVAVVAHPAPFLSSHGRDLDESLLSGSASTLVASVQGVDAALLVLTDTDLSECLFSGTFHLDQLRLEGNTVFASPPTGWHFKGVRPIRWTRRRTLAEEHHWRAQSAGQAPEPSRQIQYFRDGMAVPVPRADRPPSPRRRRVGPHHPDPARTPDPEKGDPRNPTGERFTGRRFEKALNITLKSVVFRSNGEDLTTAGTYIEMASRLFEPALLALAVLAVRGRIKR